MQKLPIGIQYFTTLRTEGYLYVDKTREIHELLQAGKFVFLARPRRFGKSLLVTTIREIFRGNRALFQGLWIEDKLDWEPRPVIAINFNDLSYRERSLSLALAEYMDQLARQHGITLAAEDEKDKFRELIIRLSEQKPIALLIDEYDKALTDLLENEQKVQEHVATLKNFYSVLKATEAEHLHFVLLTGVSKYGKISLFSDLNSLVDISMDGRYATLLGYTQAELESYFADYIDRLVSTFGVSKRQMLDWIAYWYNGYSWDGNQRVYVPFSTMLFLEQQIFANHWFVTGTPSFLIKLLRQHQIPAFALEQIGGGTALVESADINNISVTSLLFQTGYLTVKQIRTSGDGERQYVLGYPNHEVEQAFQQHLLADYLAKSPGDLTGTVLFDLRETLNLQNIEGFINILRSVFASIPHTLFLPYEAYYHSVVYLVLKLLKFEVHAERFTNLGRIDGVLELPDAIYILEFKMTTAEAAIKQIHEKQYAQPFRNQGKPIILLGIAFDRESRNIADWATETLT